MEEAIYSRLSGTAALTNLVGTRIYPIQAPQDAPKPFIVYQRISGFRPWAMGVDTGVVRPRFQFDGWAEHPDTAQAIREALRGALQRWRGTVAGVEVLDTYLIDERDRYDAATRLYGASLDAQVNYREA